MVDLRDAVLCAIGKQDKGYLTLSELRFALDCEDVGGVGAGGVGFGGRIP